MLYFMFIVFLFKNKGFILQTNSFFPEMRVCEQTQERKDEHSRFYLRIFLLYVPHSPNRLDIVNLFLKL
jgi:hypothetical protein